jgi:hypothetical protein
MQAIDAVVHQLGHSADVARHDRRPELERFVDRDRRILEPCGRDDQHIDVFVDAPHLLIVEPAVKDDGVAAGLCQVRQFGVIRIRVRFEIAMHVQDCCRDAS